MKSKSLSHNLHRLASDLYQQIAPKPHSRTPADIVPVQPSERAILAASLAALFAPRVAGALLTAPFLAAERENQRRQQTLEQELNRQLRLAQIETERMKAQSPLLVEQIREAGRARERELEAPKIAAETGKLLAETQAIQQRAEQARQKLPVDISLRIAELLHRAGDEKAGAQERQMMLAYARYLLNEYGVDLKDFLPSEIQASPAQARAAAETMQKAAETERTEASTELLKEQAQTERALRPLRVEQARARIRLIQAQELTERMQPELMRARIQEIRANIAQGWRGLALRAQSLNLAIQRQNFQQQRQLLEDIAKSRAFWERQASELDKATQISIEQTTEGTGETAITTTRTRQLDPAQASELRARAAEARRLANEYQRLEDGLRKRLLPPNNAQQKRSRQIRLQDGTVVTVEEDI